MFHALGILEYACGIERNCIYKCVCMWSACGRLSVTMVILNNAYRKRERDSGGALSLALYHLGILTL